MYIERKAVIDDIQSILGLSNKGFIKETMKAFENYIKAIPAADVVPVQRGRWETKVVRGQEVPLCSVCRCDNGTLYEYDYCPNCGARMEG